MSWCEELSYSESDCWLAAASSESVYLFAASKEQDDQVSILPVWRFVRKVEVFKRGCIRHCLGPHALCAKAPCGWKEVESVRCQWRRCCPSLGVEGEALSRWNVIIDAKLSMDGRLFATAEKSSRVGEYGSASMVYMGRTAARICRMSAQLLALRGDRISTSAKGDVQMIHGNSTRRALTLTKARCIYMARK